MALQPLFSLTPRSPRAYTYNPAAPDAPYGAGSLYSFGGFTDSGTRTLSDQFNNDEILLGFDPVDPGDQTLASRVDDLFRHCGIYIAFWGANVSTDNQYLLLLAFRRAQGIPTAQFFVGSDMVRTEELSGDETVGILLDTPGSGIHTAIYVRLASPSYATVMGFKGMDCYLL